ncbi:hypothetical protein [Streptomyces roseolilacinus]|nr:hypothetical protein [Streptomyces roseolilacinus]
MTVHDVVTIPGAGSWAKDEVVRDYLSEDELKHHLQRTTDHIGTIPEDGTWVRFQPTGLNLIAEQHNHLRLEYLVRLLGITSFIDESLISENLADNSELRAAYSREIAGHFEGLGLRVPPGEVHKFGAESVFPKIGAPLPVLDDLLKDTASLPELRTGGNYIGITARYALALAWGYAKDIVAGRQSVVIKDLPKPVTDAEAEVKGVALAHWDVLENLITGIPVGAYLGDHLADDDARIPALREFCAAVVNALSVRAVNDVRLSLTARQDLKQPSARNKTTLSRLFLAWRDAHLANNLLIAFRNRVRYAGMGAHHVATLISKKLVPADVAVYDLRPADAEELASLHTATTLQSMIEHTATLRSMA